MKLPKFLLADNSSFPDDVFIIHTDYPRFILQADTQEIEWLEDLEKMPEPELANMVQKMIEESLAFLEDEMNTYEQMDDLEEEHGL